LSADAFNQEFIERLEKTFEKALISRIYKTLDKMQKELKADNASVKINIREFGRQGSKY
jgi:hypothetical protein